MTRNNFAPPVPSVPSTPLQRWQASAALQRRLDATWLVLEQQLHALYQVDPVAFDDAVAQLRGHLTCVWTVHHPNGKQRER